MYHMRIVCLPEDIHVLTGWGVKKKSQETETPINKASVRIELTV